jgi:hypothetical protein
MQGTPQPTCYFIHFLACQPIHLPLLGFNKVSILQQHGAQQAWVQLAWWLLRDICNAQKPPIFKY